MTLEQSIDPCFEGSADFEAVVDRLWEQIHKERPVILCSSPVVDEDKIPKELLERCGDVNKRSVQVSRNLSAVLEIMMEQGLDRTLIFSGGDLLHEFFARIQCRSLQPSFEILPGVVVSDFLHKGRSYQMISKSGAFGTVEFLTDILPDKFKEEIRS
jgi:uncharacterized protein YgbK (DUF1537 family)